MTRPDSLGDQVRDVIRENLPPDAPGVIDDSAELGEEGLGLDSVGLVDLLCACEDRFDIKLPGELLLVEEGGASDFTVAMLIDEVSWRVEARAGGP